MSKVSLGTLLAAVALVVLAVVFDVPFMRGGSGVILLVGLIYAYTADLCIYCRQARGRAAAICGESSR